MPDYGYTTASGEKVSAFQDMIDGGGAGRSGPEFEGGGILSLIANLIASPYGSRQRGAPARTSSAAPTTSLRPRSRPETPDLYDYYRQGGPRGPAALRTPLQTASEEMMGRDPARNIRRLPSEALMGPDSYDYYRQGGPGGLSALETPLQAAPLSREANLPTPRPVGASFDELAEMALAQAVDNRSRIRVQQLSAVLRDPDMPVEQKQMAVRELQAMAGGAMPPAADVPAPGFGPDVRRSTAAEPDFTTRRQALEAMMRNPDYPNMARGAMGVLGDEDRVGIDPRTGRMMFGAGVPR